MSDHTPDMPNTIAALRWPTGIITLIGLLVGALGGIAANLIPVGMVTGLAVGAGIDSILNHLLNVISGGEETEANES